MNTPSVAWRLFRRRRRRLNLALQGGGAHGAYTWGVLDALAGCEALAFEGLSGSSAGAVNAVLYAEGWRRDGRAGARRALADFWLTLAARVPSEWMVRGEGEQIALSPAAHWMMRWLGQFSPEQINPTNRDALRELLAEQVDFAALRAHSPFKLFIAATQVSSGKLRLFRETELTLDALVASTCLPRLHHPVTIGGEAYWDGGYAANPAVFPLVADCDSADILLVLLNPLRRHESPQGVAAIDERTLELAFGAGLMREMAAIVQAGDVARGGWGRSWGFSGRLERRLNALRFHMIDTQDLASVQRGETRLIAHGPFLELLRDQGRERAQAWIAAHERDVGARTTVDLRRWFV